MKKSLFAICFLAVLIGSFLGSAWYHQGGAGKKEDDRGAGKVLYYVDPMNPAHTSDRPGPAPCGMPMEPVYAENETSGSATFSQYAPPGSVKISPEKQQMIGVRVEKAEMTSRGHALRTLGRVAANENLTYRVIANTEGWIQDVQGCTTGSLVREDQVMALINSYSVDFYTWQQQYLTYTAYQRPPGSQPPKTRLSRVQQPETMQQEAQQAEAQPAEQQQAETHPPGSQPAEMHQSEAHPHGSEQPEGMQPEPQQPPARSPRVRHPGAQRPMAAPGEGRQDQTPHTEAQNFYTQQLSTRNYLVDNNAHRAKLELLNIGVREEQLEELARTGQYRTQVEIRSPVTGFVLSRSISPRQKSDKGAELFRIADLTRVWVLADVFEREAPFVRPGTAARVTIPHQGKSFETEVTEVLPQFDTATRTLKVRLELNNPDFALLPDMFVDVEFLISLPPAITVPVDAVLDSGVDKTVFVDLGNGFLEPRSVSTGWRHGGLVEIVHGIMPGERVVVSGNFLVDSESRMKLAAAGQFGTRVKDPACGMEVYAGKAKKEGLTSDFEGKAHYFCSKECKDLFDEQHGGHVGKRAAAVRPGKPAIPEEQSMSGFWRDPVCGKPLEAKQAKALGFKTEYRGSTYYFCSDHCKKQFDAAQQRYLEKAVPGQGAHRAPTHGTTHHD